MFVALTVMRPPVSAADAPEAFNVPDTLMSPVGPASSVISPFVTDTLLACTKPALLMTLAAKADAARAVIKTRPPFAINWPLAVLVMPLPCAVDGSETTKEMSLSAENVSDMARPDPIATVPS